MEVQGKVVLRDCTECKKQTLQVEVMKGDLKFRGGKVKCWYCPQCGKTWTREEFDKEV